MSGMLQWLSSQARDISSGGSGENYRLLGVIREELEQDLVIVESTDPADPDKEVFFRQVVSLLGEMNGSGIGKIMWMLWSSCVVFYWHGNYPVMVKVTKRFREGLGRDWIV
jgi:hypothetical protein